MSSVVALFEHATCLLVSLLLSSAAIGKLVISSSTGEMLFSVLAIGELAFAFFNLRMWHSWQYWRVAVASILGFFVVYHLAKDANVPCGCTGFFEVSDAYLLSACLVLLVMTVVLPTNSRGNFSRKSRSVNLTVLICSCLTCVSLTFHSRSRPDSDCDLAETEFREMIFPIRRQFEQDNAATYLTGNLNCSKCYEEMSLLASTKRMIGMDIFVLVNGDQVNALYSNSLPSYVNIISPIGNHIDPTECNRPLNITVVNDFVF